MHIDIDYASYGQPLHYYAADAFAAAATYADELRLHYDDDIAARSLPIEMTGQPPIFSPRAAIAEMPTLDDEMMLYQSELVIDTAEGQRPGHRYAAEGHV